MKYSQMMEIVLYPRKLPALLAVASATLILVSPAQASTTNIYLNSPITLGASTDVGHVGWTLLDDLYWSVGKDISWTQGINTNVQALQNAVSNGTHQARTQFDVVQVGNPLGTPYLSLATEDHVFTSVHVNGQIVIASSSYGKVKLTYDPAARGETGQSTSTTWNPKTNIVESGSKTLSPTLPLNGAEPAAVDGKITAYLRLGNSLDGIAGNSWAAGYENWIQLDGTTWNLNWSPETFYSSYYPGRPNVSNLVWWQQINATLPVVFANLASGRNLSQATLEFVKLGAAGPVTFMQVNMNQFRFDDLSFRDSYDDSSMTVSADFATMSQTSWEIRPDGTRGAAISFGHNYILEQPMSGALAYSVANFGTGNLSPVAAVPEPASIGTISFNPSTLAVGGTTTASATATSGLSVTFSSSATPTICSVSGSNVSALAAGTCTIAANQAGNGTYSAATQVTQNITVDPFNIIDHYYQNILNRLADAGGKAFWQGEAARMSSFGVSPSEAYIAMARYFFTSPEFLARGFSDDQFVRNLYLTFFNRSVDQGGLDYWKSQLTSGSPRDMVMYAYMFSPEFSSFMLQNVGYTYQRAEVGVVIDFYRAAFGRLPDDGGLKYWVNQFRTAQCSGNPTGSVYSTAISIAGSFFGSAEYWANPPTSSKYISDQYNAFMRRSADLQGFNYWVGQLSTGAQSYDQVRRQFIDSPEFAQRVQAVAALACVGAMQ